MNDDKYLFVSNDFAVSAFHDREGFGRLAAGGNDRDIYEAYNLSNSEKGTIADDVWQGNREIELVESGTIEPRFVIHEPKSDTTTSGSFPVCDAFCLKGRNQIHDYVTHCKSEGRFYD